MDDRDAKGRFVAGAVGNPAGRPKKGESLTDALRERVNKDELADILLGMARSGNVRAATYIYDRIDGQPRQHVEMSNERDAEWLELFRAERQAAGDSKGD